MGGHDVKREIDAPSLHVLVDVPQDVDELHLDAKVDGVETGGSVFIPVDFNQNQPNSFDEATL